MGIKRFTDGLILKAQSSNIIPSTVKNPLSPLILDNQFTTHFELIPQVMGHSFEISTFLFFVAPMTLITVLYILIGLRLRRSNRLKRGYGGYGVTFTGKTTNGASSQAHNTLGAEVSLSNSQDEFELRNMKKNHRRRQEVTPSRRVLKMLGK